MKFTVFFANFTTLEIVAQNVVAANAKAAATNMRRRLRKYDSLQPGDAYGYVVLDDWQPLDIPADFYEVAQRGVAR